MTKMGGLFGTCCKSLTPLKRARLKSKLDHIIQLRCRRVHTYASCETTSNIGELRPPRSIKNDFPFRRTMANYICSSCHFVLSLHSESYNIYMYIIKPCLHGIKTYGIKGKDTLMEDWKELNKETCM